MRRLFLGALLALTLGVGVAFAGGKKRLEAPEVQKNLSTLSAQVVWQRSLDDAKALARKEGKLILWVHVLGDMDGAT